MRKCLLLIITFIISVSSYCSPVRITSSNVYRLPYANEYVVAKKIDLGGQSIQLPQGCKIIFKSRGHFCNGVVEGDNIQIVSTKKRVRFGRDVQIKGKNWSAPIAFSEWFDIKPDCHLNNENVYLSGQDNYVGFSNLLHFPNVRIKQGVYYVQGSLIVSVDRQTIDGCGATIKYKSLKPYDAFIRIGSLDLDNNSISDISIKNLVIIGDKTENKQNTEWNHGIQIVNSKNVLIENVTVLSNKGDGLNISEVRNGNAYVVPQNIVVKGILCEDNHRNGLSVTGVNGLLIQNSVIKATKGTSPESGIDIEPNHQNALGKVLYSQCKNIEIKDCEISDNTQCGLLIQAPDSKFPYIPVDTVHVIGCDFRNNPVSIRECMNVSVEQCEITLDHPNSGIVLQNAGMRNISLKDIHIISYSDSVNGVGVYITEGGDKKNLHLEDLKIEGAFKYGLYAPSNESAKITVDKVGLKNIVVSNCWHNIFIGNCARNVTYDNVESKSNGYQMKTNRRYNGCDWSWSFEKRDEISTRIEE